jgi:hypothetical protein
MLDVLDDLSQPEEGCNLTVITRSQVFKLENKLVE